MSFTWPTRAFVGYFALTLAACSAGDPTDDANAIDQAATAKTPVDADFVVLHGGMNSCGGSSEHRVDPRVQGNGLIFSMLKYADKVGNKPYIVTCYPFWTNDPAAKLESPLQNKIYWVERLSTSGEPSQPKEATVSEFFERLPTLVNGSKAKHVAVIGHSYGGFTAMLSARKLQQSNVHVAKLVTLDPISMAQCTTEVFLNQISANQPAEGCTRAPTNDGYVDDAVVQGLAKSTSWSNYFQSVDRYLHSGPIVGGAIDNVALSFGITNTEGVGNHCAFVTSDRLIGIVMGLIR